MLSFNRNGLFILLALLLSVVCSTIATSQSIQINEVLSSNNELYSDEDGDFEDWIELYNASEESINLEGYGLSDNYNNPFKWVLPNYSIEPGEYLIIWASGKDREGQGDGWTNGVQRLFYPLITGSNVSDLGNHSTFPERPATSNVLHKFFEAPLNIADNYGQHLYTWVEPPQTGGYRFWISSDDGSELYLSSDESEDNTTLIASVPGWTEPREWLKYNQQQSELIFLEAGKRYYLSALMKEGTGGDNLAVRWQWPNGSMEEPLCATNCYIRTKSIHTNFRISTAGEEIILTSPSGERIDEVPPIPIPSNKSFGRSSDGSEWGYFEEPSPGKPNNYSTKANIAETPSIEPAGGIFRNPVLITINAPDNSEVFYTTDGSTPNAEIGIKYNAPFLANQSMVIRAVATSPDKLTSETTAASFAISGSEVHGFGSNLPIMVIQQFDTPITPGNRTISYMSLYETKNDSAFMASVPDLASRININIRGTSSQSFPKKGYGFHILEEDDSNREISLLGMPEEHNWILHGPYSDKSLMRNALSYDLGRDLGHYSPRSRFIELFLHDGQGTINQSHYAGVYLLVERIKIAEGRVEIADVETYHNSEPEITGGYIFKIDRLNPGEEGFKTARSSDFVFVRPNEESISKPQADYLRSYIDSLETALFGPNFKDPEIGYAKYLDVPTFIDMHLITELCKEIDGYRLSTFFTKDRNGKIKSGPLWDFNLSLGNADYVEGWNPEGWYYSEIDERSYMYGWYNRLFEDESFERRYKQRYRQLRQTVFSFNQIENKVLDYYHQLKDPADRNFQRYDILGEYVWPNWFIAETYEEEIDWMLNWVKRRLDWMDDQLGNPYTLIHYWNFNEDNDWETPAYTIREGELLIDPGPETEVTFDTGQNFTGENARFEEEAGAHLRVNNPIGTILNYEVSTEGFKDIIISYETRRSGSGANRQYISYTIDADEYLPLDTILVTDEPTLYTWDFSNKVGVSNNSAFQFRIEIDYIEDGSGGQVGNNRFDNFTVEGEALEGINLPPELVNALPAPLQLIAQSEGGPLNLNDFFEDPEGDPIIYSVSVDNPDLLTAVIAGDDLQFLPIRQGHTSMTISVSDDQNSPVMFELDILIHPDPVHFQSGNTQFIFDFWSADEPEGSFPNHMIFMQSEVTDPDLSDELLIPYTIPLDDYNEDDIDNLGFPYRNTRRTRLNGLFENGISFINTGRDRDLGAAVLALNTLGVSSGQLDWEASTVIANSRVYHLRLQYRTGLDEDWRDFLDIVGEPVEYKRDVQTDNRKSFSHVLPVELLDQEYIQLRWFYYYTGERLSSSSGARDMIALHKVELSTELITSSHAESESINPLIISPNPVNGLDIQFNKIINASIYDLKGHQVGRIEESNSAKINHLKSGVYIIQTDDGEVKRFIKQ